MMTKTLASLALVAGCAVALTAPAVQAQTLDMQSSMYEHLLQDNPAFRQSRMQKECGPITDLQLRLNCIDSLGAVDDERGLEPQEGLTGGSTGTMNSTGAPPYNPNMPIPDAGR
jgi:hypothetical protein